MSIGIFYRLLFSLILLFLIYTGFMAYGLINEAKDAYEDARLHQAHNMAEGLAQGSLDALAVNDYELIEGWLRGSGAIDDFAYAYLSKSNGLIVSHTDLGLIAHRAEAIGKITSPVVKNITYLKRPVIEVIHPSYLGSKHMANAHLAYFIDTKSFYSEEIIIRGIGLLVVTLIVLSLVTFFILRWVLSPVKNLADVMHHVTINKSYDERVITQRKDEMGLLVNSFNNMLEQIQQRDEALVTQKEKAEQLADKALIDAHEIALTNNELETEISERIEIESRLQDLSENLEQRVKERTEKLREMHKVMADISRRAGMAEVASGVLHNVGNVLNSVNISSSMLRENLLKSGAKKLSKVVELLDENKHQLSEFLTNDDKGGQIPEFLKLLSEKLQNEHEILFSELDSLDDNISHIKNVIRMQQSYAVDFGVSEQIHIVDLINDALKINIDRNESSKITIIKEYQDLPIMNLDKHKVLQIIVNLISNAKHALFEADIEHRLLTIHLSASENEVVVKVVDNGVGIASDDLPNLFKFGFTKRQGGHGFGLHNCGLVAKTLGGKITVHSDGLGMGACFMFSLPVIT